MSCSCYMNGGGCRQETFQDILIHLLKAVCLGRLQFAPLPINVSRRIVPPSPMFLHPGFAQRRTTKEQKPSIFPCLLVVWAGMSRSASHAGSWYTDSSDLLHTQLHQWLQDAGQTPGTARAVIAPHAGYAYSGPTAAFAYGNVTPQNFTRIFILGPSHHYYLEGCALTHHTVYDTPIGQLRVDAAVNASLLATGAFETMSTKVDEEEHSIEMHLPYIAEIMRGQEFTIVPILVGNLSPKNERAYAELLRPFFEEPTSFFVISSDFCHWGSMLALPRSLVLPTKPLRFSHIKESDSDTSLLTRLAATSLKASKSSIARRWL
eukprot:m.371994 g.371994  ORF g.371994 m.371994 type:complete len:320 (-) comp56143_c0_seq14:1947-2906(-)